MAGFENIVNNAALPGMQEIIELARLLRDKGDKVLSASSKLSLSTKLLYNLNEKFSMIVNETDDLESSFQVCTSSRNEVFRDIKFLHDFVQKAIGLKIQHSHNDTKVLIDITKFRHLKYLELHKISIAMVKGIQGIRGQVECIICTGGSGVKSLHELLSSCGADAGTGFVWGSLRRLALPYNTLTHLDKSLEFAPWLEKLDLSHNTITKANELEYLPNLKNVHLGYNNLDSVPLFHKATYNTLRKLILKNNYIDNISGLQGLDSLIELDLSYNCLTDHSMLWPLETMSMLMWVCLEGNPLAYHPRHRLHTIKHLHPLLSDSKFILDKQPLNKSENLFVSENRISAIRSTVYRSSNMVNTMSSLATVSPEISLIENSSPVNQVEISVQSTASISGLKQSSKKRTNVREAVIAEDELEQEIPKTKLVSSVTNSSETSMDHLETKRQILALRAKYGEENWLSSHSAAHIQSIMGLQQTPSSTPTVLSSTLMDIQQNIDAVTAAVSEVSISPILSSTDDTYIGEVESIKDQGSQIENTEKPEDDIKKNVGEHESTDEGIMVEIQTENEPDEKASIKGAVQEIQENSYDSDEERGDLYLVQKKKTTDEFDDIFLIITPEHIKERDTLTNTIRYRWATNTVLSCVLGRGIPTTVDITFDTTRKDREARTYIADLDDAKKIVQTLNEMIKTQPMVLKIFKCMKCSTHFSQDGDNNIITFSTAGLPPKCPTCMSTLVIKIDELPATASGPLGKITDKSKPETQKDAASEARLWHSSSQSSIGGTENGAISIATSLKHFDSHSQAQISCSATSLEESRESTPSAGAINNNKYESDIEILSNPSQSSIEVLDDGSKSTTPKRKKSSEERRVAVAPSLLTIPDTTLLMAGLTESSSSGSLTDSVCTAYENKALKLDKIDSNSKITDDVGAVVKGDTLDSEGSFAPVTNLTSMLGELLQSMKIGHSKDTSTKSEDSSEFVGTNIHYSYTNFSNVDHRIKLHIILNVFEHENEELAFLLRADILTQTSAAPFPGCLVISTAKVYILKISGPEGEDPQRWLHKECSWTIDRLRSFAPLSFKQGVLVELQQPNKSGENVTNNVILCILQDFQRTSNFLFYLTDSPLPPSCEVEFTVPQYYNTSMKSILKSSKNHKEEDAIRLLALFSSAVLKFSHETEELKVASLIITSSTLIVTQDKVHWLLSENNKLPSIVAEQGMSNLIEVDLDGNSLKMSFLDEMADVETNWTLKFVSSSAAEAVINSIRLPWEELFSVPLQINSEATATSSTAIEPADT